MQNDNSVIFENEKQLKESLEHCQTSDLVYSFKNLKDCNLLCQAVKAL